jgi:hypothetical protein
VFYDKTGEYGITQSPIGIINPSTNTLQFIQSPLFHYIANSTKIIGNNFNVKTSLFLPIIPENINIKCVNDLYSYFGFSTDEIAKINNFSVPKYKDQFLSCDGKTLLNGNKIIKTEDHENKNDIENQESESDVEDQENEETGVESKHISLELDTNTIAHSNSKKKTLKKRSNILASDESSEENKTASAESETNADKIFNPTTNRYVKNTPANRKKIERKTLKSGGRSKKRTKTLKKHN